MLTVHNRTYNALEGLFVALLQLLFILKFVFTYVTSCKLFEMLTEPNQHITCYGYCPFIVSFATYNFVWFNCAYFRMLVYLVNHHIYLYIFQCTILLIMKSTGGGKESRTPDLLLARQAL